MVGHSGQFPNFCLRVNINILVPVPSTSRMMMNVYIMDAVEKIDGGSKYYQQV